MLTVNQFSALGAERGVDVFVYCGQPYVKPFLFHRQFLRRPLFLREKAKAKVSESTWTWTLKLHINKGNVPSILGQSPILFSWSEGPGSPGTSCRGPEGFDMF